MLTVNNKVKDALNDDFASLQLKSYTSVPEIYKLVRFLLPFRFSTLQKIAPGKLKSSVTDLLDYLNGKDELITYDSPESLPLWDEKDIPFYDGGKKPYIIPFLLKDKKAPAILVAPGGAYLHLAMDHEGIQIAKRFNELGFHAVVLCYRVSPSRYPCMQLDMMRSVQIMRSRAEEWGIIENKITAVGFSAGGHLVLSVNGLSDELSDLTGDLSHINAKPDALLGGYPMCDLKCEDFGITCDRIFLGKDYSEELSNKLCIKNVVNRDYPPTFLFTMENDPTVPPKTNCIELKGVLDSLGVQNELHVFSGDRHGFALADGEEAGTWVEKSVAFLKRHGKM